MEKSQAAAKTMHEESDLDHVITRVLVELVDKGETKQDLDNWGPLFEAAMPSVAAKSDKS